MKIAMFTNTYLPHMGGVARSVSLFAQDLRHAGHRVLIIAPTFPGYEAHDDSEPDIFRTPAIQKFNGSDFSVRIPSPFLVDEQIDKFEPDIIHSHHPYLLGDAALRAARRRNLPLVFTHHTLYEEYAHYIAKNSENMKLFAALLSKNYANLCDHVIAPSRSIQHLIQERGVTTPVTEIPTGVDISFFSAGNGNAFRIKQGIPDDAFVIGHLGRLAPEKNLEYLAESVAKMMATHSNVYFLVVGKGPDEHTFLNIFERSNLQNRLVLPGKATGQDLADAYQAMDLFVFSSKSETQGMVLVEAMASGTPVIALDASGAREVVADGRNGRLLAGDADENTFAETVAKAVNAPYILDQWRKETGPTAEKFERQHCADTLLSLYEALIRTKQQNNEYKTEYLDLWDKFLLAGKTEWDLVAEKTESVLQTIDEKYVAGLNDNA